MFIIWSLSLSSLLPTPKDTPDTTDITTGSTAGYCQFLEIRIFKDSLCYFRKVLMCLVLLPENKFLLGGLLSNFLPLKTLLVT